MHSIAFVVFDGFQSMALAAQSAFEYANISAGRPLYHVEFLSEHGGPVAASGGMSVLTAPFHEHEGVHDTIIVGGSDAVLEAAPPAVLDYIRRSARTARRTASICSGTFVLAQAGLLDGRRATTHWAYARQLRAAYPAITVDDDRIYIVDGAIWSSAGMTAGIDMAVAMVEHDMGPELARSVAQKLVMFHRRAGGQSQHSAMLALSPRSDRIQGALAFARANLTEALTVEQLAAAAKLSARQFSRSFRAETGQSPARAVEQLRLEAARQMMEQTRLHIDEIAGQVGFAAPRRMREAFLRAYGQPPQTIRRNARSDQLRT
ncbi:MAG: GlxA family transcriptional regulator [Massilia sp.]